MSTIPGQYDFTIYQGATFTRVFTWQSGGSNVNLTGYTARLQIRTSHDAASPFITLTTENGGITLGGAAGTITVTISASQTTTINQSSGVYDLELVTGTTVVRLLEGRVNVSKEVTR